MMDCSEIFEGLSMKVKVEREKKEKIVSVKPDVSKLYVIPKEEMYTKTIPKTSMNYISDLRNTLHTQLE